MKTEHKSDIEHLNELVNISRVVQDWYLNNKGLFINDYNSLDIQAELVNLCVKAILEIK